MSTPFSEIDAKLQHLFDKNEHGNAHMNIAAVYDSDDATFWAVVPQFDMRLREWRAGDPKPVFSPPAKMMLATVVHRNGAKWVYAVDQRLHPERIHQDDLHHVLQDPWKLWSETAQVASRVMSSGNSSASNVLTSFPVNCLSAPGKGL